MMYVLVKGDLKTREKIVVNGLRVEPYTEEANQLNQAHYELCFLEYWGKSADGRYTPNKRHIWFTEEGEKL